MNASWHRRRSHQRVSLLIRRNRADRAERRRVQRVWDQPESRASLRDLGTCLHSDCPLYVCPGNGETECPRHGGFGNCCDHPDCPGNYLYASPVTH